MQSYQLLKMVVHAVTLDSAFLQPTVGYSSKQVPIVTGPYDHNLHSAPL
jgi:hypothetical protein